MKSIPKLLNCFIISILVFFISALLVRYFLPRTATLIISFLIFFIIFGLLLSYSFRDVKKNDATNFHQDKLKLALFCMDSTERISKIIQLIEMNNTKEIKQNSGDSKNKSNANDRAKITIFDSVGNIMSVQNGTMTTKNCNTSDSNTTATENTSKSRNMKEIMLFDFLRFENISGDDVLKCFTTANSKKCECIILCNYAEKSANETAEFLGVTIKDWNNVFEYMKKMNAYPKIKENNNSNDCTANSAKKSSICSHLKKIIQTAIEKKRVKGYILTSLILITSSIITKYAIYYLCVAAVCCMLAIAAIIKDARKKHI